MHLLDPSPRERAKSLIKRALRSIGLEVKKTRSQSEDALLPLFETALDALYNRGGAFRCPINKIVYNNGFGYAKHKWHPFRAALQAHQRGESRAYRGSLLERYYATWQPDNALEALAGFNGHGSPAALAALPSYAFYHAPWTVHPPDETRGRVEWFSNRDNATHGRPALRLASHGFKMHGPVHPEKGALEYRRLLRVYDSIRTHGYDRSHGEIGVVILRRGSELRYLNRRGMHRAATMAALGHSTVPARLNLPFVIDLNDVNHWPQVRAGVWDRESAIQYFSFLFDHESRQWADEQGLLAE